MTKRKSEIISGYNIIKIIADLLDIHGAPTVETLGDIFLDKNVRYVPPKGSIDEDIGGKVYEIYLQALRGDKNACRYLSNCYREGKGVQQNAEKAQYWERKATCEKKISQINPKRLMVMLNQEIRRRSSNWGSVTIMERVFRRITSKPSSGTGKQQSRDWLGRNIIWGSVTIMERVFRRIT